jgi:hypothetical protein
VAAASGTENEYRPSMLMFSHIAAIGSGPAARYANKQILSIRDRSDAAAVEASFSTSANFKRTASNSAPWVSNADDNSTRSFGQQKSD